MLVRNDCRVEVCTDPSTILPNSTIKKLIGDRCDGVLGQLTEDWSDELFGALKSAGGKMYSNYAVGYNNVKVPAATANGIGMGNTPGELRPCLAVQHPALTLQRCTSVCVIRGPRGPLPIVKGRLQQ